MSDSNGEQPSKRRRGPGRPFRPGQSGNPGGRCAGLAALQERAREHGPAMLEFLVSVAKDATEETRVRVIAAGLVLDRGYGRAPQANEITISEAPSVDRDAIRARLERFAATPRSE